MHAYMHACMHPIHYVVEVYVQLVPSQMQKRELPPLHPCVLRQLKLLSIHLRCCESYPLLLLHSTTAAAATAAAAKAAAAAGETGKRFRV